MQPELNAYFAHRFETFFSYEYHWAEYEAEIVGGVLLSCFLVCFMSRYSRNQPWRQISVIPAGGAIGVAKNKIAVAGNMGGVGNDANGYN